MAEERGIVLKRIPAESVSHAGNGADLKTGASRDEQDLAHFGKRQQLKVL